MGVVHVLLVLVHGRLGNTIGAAFDKRGVGNEVCVGSCKIAMTSSVKDFLESVHLKVRCSRIVSSTSEVPPERGLRVPQPISEVFSTQKKPWSKSSLGKWMSMSSRYLIAGSQPVEPGTISCNYYSLPPHKRNIDGMVLFMAFECSFVFLGT